MRTVFEEEEEIADPHQDREQDRELTISSTTLLVIFFGLVLICGVFFSLGYTLGRRTSSEASQLSQPASAAPASTPQPYESQAKPSPVSQAATPAPAETSATDSSTSTDSQEASQAANPAPAAQPTVKSVSLPVPQPQPSTPAPTPAAALSPAAPQTGTMVQIAAISNPADADVLVAALQKRGYSVSTHRVLGDSLIRVQVGPFSNRADAAAMRQKLLNDGYNAILK